jgi:chromosome segregation ATPase
MATLDYPSKEQQADTIELELGLEIPVLGAADNELASLRSAYDAASNIRDELQEKLKTAVAYSNEQAKLINELKEKPSEINELKVLLGKTTVRNNLLSNDLLERDNEIEVLNDEVMFLRENISDLQSFKTQLDQADEDNQMLSKQLKERDNEVETLNGKVSALRSKIIDIQNLREQLKRADSDNQVLSKSLEDQRIHLTTRIEELDSQIVAFELIKKEFNNRGTELKELQDALGHSDNKIYQLTGEIEQRTEKENLYQQQLQKNKNSIELHEAKIQAQEIQLEELSELRENLNNRDHKIAELSKTIDNARVRIHSLEADMNEARAVVDSLQGKIEEANKNIPLLEKNIRMRDDKITSLESDVAVRKKRLESYNTSLKLRDSKITSLENVLNQAKENIAPLRNDLATQETRIRELEKLFNEAKKITSIDKHEKTN